MQIELSRRSMLGGLAAVALASCGKPKVEQSAAKTAETTTPKSETGFAEVPGGKVWWMRAGGDTKKTPLLVLHGGPGAAHDYLLPLQALADERPVIFYDQLGCGKSDAPADDSLYTVPRSVDELTAVRKALKLDHVILYGHSWGGMLALEYFATMGAPGVEKLVLASTPPSIAQFVAGTSRLIDQLPNGAGARLKALEEAGQTSSKEYQDLVGLFYQTYLCRLPKWPDNVNASLDYLSKSPAYRVMNGPNEFTVIGNMKDWDRSQDLSAVMVPTLQTRGEFDEVSLDCAQTIQAGIPGSELMVFGGASHLTMDEQPDQYNKAIRAFIA